MSASAQAAEETRRRITEVARDQFTASPYEEVTLTSIASAAGVSQQTVLNQFGGKGGVSDADPDAAPATGRLDAGSSDAGRADARGARAAEPRPTGHLQCTPADGVEIRRWGLIP